MPAVLGKLRGGKIYCPLPRGRVCLTPQLFSAAVSQTWAIWLKIIIWQTNQQIKHPEECEQLLAALFPGKWNGDCHLEQQLQSCILYELLSFTLLAVFLVRKFTSGMGCFESFIFFPSPQGEVHKSACFTQRRLRELCPVSVFLAGHPEQHLSKPQPSHLT